MADGTHVHANLMRAACLKLTFHNGDKAVAFKDSPMGYGPFSLFGVVVNAEAEAVVGVPADSSLNGTFVFLDIAPYHGGVYAVY